MQTNLRRAASALVAGTATFALAVAMAPGASAAEGPNVDEDNFVGGVHSNTTYRIAGSDRIATAIKASQTKANWAGCGVILARYDDFADALVSAPLADVNDVPILVNPQDVLDGRVKQEIARLSLSNECESSFKVTIVGGTGAISETISNKLAESYDVLRLRGIDRYATALQVASATMWDMHNMGWNDMNAFVTTGKDFPDALAAGTAAAEDNGIVVLSRGNEADPDTSAFLKQFATYVLDWSGESPELVTAGSWAEAAYPDADKHYSGSDRYQTASKLADAYFQFPIHHATPDTENNVGVASGLTYADAVVAAGFMANSDGPLLLTKPGSLNAYTAAYLRSQSDWVDNAFVFGGTSSLSPSIATQVSDSLFN